MNMLFSFQGRIGRMQWWLTSLGIVAFYIAFMMVAGLAATGMNLALDPVTGRPELPMALVVSTLGVVILGIWVSISAMVRRYHDRNKSGWWYFICLVPIIGPLWQFIELGFLDGTPGGNSYGVRGGSQDFGRPQNGDFSKDFNGDGGDMDALIQQRLVDRQQRLVDRQQQTNASAARSATGNRGLTGERPVFGKRT